MQRLTPFWVVSLACTALSAWAEEPVAETGPYLLIGSGFSVVGQQETKLGAVDADIEYADAGLADLSLGYRVLPHLRIEANLNYRQHHIENIDSEGPTEFGHKGDIHAIGALGNVLVDYPLGRQIERDSIPFVIPYAGVGVGVLWTKPRAELRTVPEQKIRGESAEFAWNVLAGVDIPVTRRTGLQIGYRYLESLDQSWNLRVGASSAGNVDAPYQAHEGRVSLRIGY